MVGGWLESQKEKTEAGGSTPLCGRPQAARAWDKQGVRIGASGSCVEEGPGARGRVVYVPEWFHICHLYSCAEGPCLGKSAYPPAQNNATSTPALECALYSAVVLVMSMYIRACVRIYMKWNLYSLQIAMDGWNRHIEIAIVLLSTWAMASYFLGAGAGSPARDLLPNTPVLLS